MTSTLSFKDHGSTKRQFHPFKKGSKLGMQSSGHHQLYWRIGRTGVETNVLEWYRNWCDIKISEYPAEFRSDLRKMERSDWTDELKQEIDELDYEPELPTSKDAWVPTEDEQDELANEPNDVKRTYLERRMYSDWATDKLRKNAIIRSGNDAAKKYRDDLVTRLGRSRKDLVFTLMGSVLDDMSFDSKQKIKDWKRRDDKHVREPEKYADTLEKAYELCDWLFIFEAALSTHLQADSTLDECSLIRKQESHLEVLKHMKHESGSIERWIQKFEDQLLVCETVGINLTDAHKRNYLIENLNPRIFDSIITIWSSEATRKSLPKTYSELKGYIINDYSNQTTRTDRMKIILSVAGSGFKKQETSNEQPEPALVGKEKETTDGKEGKGTGGGSSNAEGGSGSKPCFICGKTNHLYKLCYHYDKDKSVDENKQAYEKKMIDKKKNKKDKDEKTEKSGVCMELFCEPCYSMGIGPGEIDFIYDSGTQNGVAGIEEKDIITDVQEEMVYLQGVGGQTSLSYECGNTIFGKTRILKSRKGSVLVSNFATKSLYQVLNPHEDVFVLKGWDHNPMTKGKTYRFERDAGRYGDQLLHCTLKLEEVKSFFGTEKSYSNLDKAKGFYDPSKASPEVSSEVKRVQEIHTRYCHASAADMLALVENGAIDASKTAIHEWKKTFKCSSCIEASMIEHERMPSSNAALKETEPGRTCVGDLMFIETTSKDNKSPMYVQVDVATKLVCAVALSSKKEHECLRAITTCQAEYKLRGREMKRLTFDREPGILANADGLRELAIELIPKAAGQKAALAEVTIREIKKKARSTKQGVKDAYNYYPPNQWNVDLCLDTVQIMNRIPKNDNKVSPLELFANTKVDYMRDVRGDWGEPVIVKKPKELRTTLEPTAEWGVIVRRIMNGSGVLKVYLVNSKKYAYRLKFERATPPSWVLDELNKISPGKEIGFEATDDPIESLVDVIEDEKVIMPEPENLTEALSILDTIEAQELSQDTDALEEVTTGQMNQNALEEMNPIQNDPALDNPIQDIALPPEPKPESDEPYDQGYRTRSGRLVKKPKRYEDAMAIVRESYEGLETITTEPTLELYQKAVKVRPHEAKAALVKEVKKALGKAIWHPVHMKDLTDDQIKLILPMMKNFVEKTSPTGEFLDYKVRILMRGDKQLYTAESEGPVCRPESLRICLCISAHEDLEELKIDITAAFMNTLMPKDVKHRWMRLDKDVVKVLLELHPDVYEPYVLPDGSLIVEMDKLMYGYVEAPYYWYLTISSVFLAAGYKQCLKDPCVFMKEVNGMKAICALTVDDCMFFATKNEKFIEDQINMLQDAFKEITVERTGEAGIGIIGMQMVREGKKVILSQPKWENKVKDEFNIDSRSPNPALNDMLNDDETKEPIQDQKKFLSLNSLLMYGATRTYPELLPVVGKLATKYNKATEDDMKKAQRVAEYVNACRGNHQHVMAPKSLKLIAQADASYAGHSDAKSQTGGIIGFEAQDGCSCNVAFISSKQSIVAKSAGESELIAENKVAEYVVWARDLLEELGYKQDEPTPMYVDSTCAMQMVKNGSGSFKRAKHIKVRYFWLKDLIDQGVITLVYRKTDELTADMLTKPLQGAKFGYLLKDLIGWNQEQVDMSDNSSDD